MKREFWKAPKIERESILLFLISFSTIQLCLYLSRPQYQNPRIFLYSIILSVVLPNLVLDTLSRLKTRKSKIFSLILTTKEAHTFIEKPFLILSEVERTTFKKNLGVEFPDTGLSAKPLPDKENKWEILIQNEPHILKLKANKLSIYKKVKKAVVL